MLRAARRSLDARVDDPWRPGRVLEPHAARRSRQTTRETSTPVEARCSPLSSRPRRTPPGPAAAARGQRLVAPCCRDNVESVTAAFARAFTYCHSSRPLHRADARPRSCRVRRDRGTDVSGDWAGLDDGTPKDSAGTYLRGASSRCLSDRDRRSARSLIPECVPAFRSRRLNCRGAPAIRPSWDRPISRGRDAIEISR